MKITQIRNATNRIEYGGLTFLLDPWLAPQGAFRFYGPDQKYFIPDPVKEQLFMPFFPLPMPAEDILRGVDYYLITHLHPDHIDMAEEGTVGGPLRKSVPIICQNEEDAAVLAASGFETVIVLPEQGHSLGTVTLKKAPARHGVIRPCGKAMGVVFRSEKEKTLYSAGDTIFYSGVIETLETEKPEIIMLNCCAAETVENGRLIMNDEDVAAVSTLSPEALLYLTHLDNVAHATITRHRMKGLLAGRGINHYVMPGDGESQIF